MDITQLILDDHHEQRRLFAMLDEIDATDTRTLDVIWGRLTDKMIVVQTVKGDERWEIERSADTKVTGDLKVGAKVTIEYRMVANTAEVKPEK